LVTKHNGERPPLCSLVIQLQLHDASLTANVQSVQYSANFVYATTQGIPSYVVGPYLDGNTNQAGNQNAIFKFPLTPSSKYGNSSCHIYGKYRCIY
jgi:hypothetical protein